jgi:hypothetical protein
MEKTNKTPIFHSFNHLMGLLVNFWLMSFPDHPVPDIAAFTVHPDINNKSTIKYLINSKCRLTTIMDFELNVFELPDFHGFYMIKWFGR